jgi:hypothetical protein
VDAQFAFGQTRRAARLASRSAQRHWQGVDENT